MVLLKPVLRDPNLTLSFSYMTKIMNNRNGNMKHKTKYLVLRKAGLYDDLILIYMFAFLFIDESFTRTELLLCVYEPQHNLGLGCCSVKPV